MFHGFASCLLPLFTLWLRLLPASMSQSWHAYLRHLRAVFSDEVEFCSVYSNDQSKTVWSHNYYAEPGICLACISPKARWLFCHKAVYERYAGVWPLFRPVCILKLTLQSGGRTSLKHNVKILSLRSVFNAKEMLMVKSEAVLYPYIGLMGDFIRRVWLVKSVSSCGLINEVPQLPCDSFVLL